MASAKNCEYRTSRAGHDHDTRQKRDDGAAIRLSGPDMTDRRCRDKRAVNMTQHAIWLGVGFLGQALFSGRFLVQWLVSEAKRESVLPTAFWWLSISGGITLLVYAIYQQDPVFITGQAFGLLVYTRNLFLIRSKRKSDRAGATPDVDL
jgi:lipid-A-disaccharide synthase-like uncharacterized protein